MNMERLLIINGHPDKESFNYALHVAYKDGALSAGKEVKEIALATMQFSTNLQFGYRKRTDLEPDLLDAREKIQWAEHIVWIFPIWWGGMPALLKGFIDRLFIPGFAIEYQEKSPFPKKLLSGKTSEIICTMDTPIFYYKLAYCSRGTKLLSKNILAFCGIKNKRITYFAVVKNSTDEKRKNWLGKAKKMGEKS
jgi:putative NADPH-quinone reductase